VKLIPVEDAYEIRVQGAERHPRLLRLPRPHHRGVRRRRLLPHRGHRGVRCPRRLHAGLVFRGRIAEDFKPETSPKVQGPPRRWPRSRPNSNRSASGRP
jgi:hypothetical protein